MQLVLQPTKDQVVLADPTVIAPSESPDGKWHLLCHSLLGIHQYSSDDGERWHEERVLFDSLLESHDLHLPLQKWGLKPHALLYYALQVARRKSGTIITSLRPFVFIEGDTFYLCYEQRQFSWLRGRIVDQFSEIFLSHSKDLIAWSEPQSILSSTEKCTLVACPSLVKEGQQYVLYFSFGNKFTGDTSLMEPEHIAYATSKKINGPYTIQHHLTVYDQSGSIGSQTGSFRIREIGAQRVALCNQITVNDSNSTSRLHYAQAEKNMTIRLGSSVLSETDHEHHNLSNSYVGDIAFHNDEKYLFFNVRIKNRWFDRVTLNQGVWGVLNLAFKNVLFNKEEIYLVKIRGSEVVGPFG